MFWENELFFSIFTSICLIVIFTTLAFGIKFVYDVRQYNKENEREGRDRPPSE